MRRLAGAAEQALGICFLTGRTGPSQPRRRETDEPDGVEPLRAVEESPPGVARSRFAGHRRQSPILRWSEPTTTSRTLPCIPRIAPRTNEQQLGRPFPSHLPLVGALRPAERACRRGSSGQGSRSRLPNIEQTCSAFLTPRPSRRGHGRFASHPREVKVPPDSQLGGRRWTTWVNATRVASTCDGGESEVLGATLGATFYI